MRSAICLYGIVGGIDGKGGLGSNIPFKECYETYKKHIIDINNTDVFIHSWSVDAEKPLVELYKPKKHKFQKQIKFVYEPFIRKKYTDKNRDHGYRALSKWFSVKESIKLKKEYEIEHNFKYDWIMLTRFDTLFFTDLDFSKCDPQSLYVPNFNTPNGWGEDTSVKPDKINRSENIHSLSDMWYFGNSNIINNFLKIYNGVKNNKYRVSQHKAAWDCFLDLGYKRKIIKYILYRHYDFELYRWRLGNLYSKGDKDASKK
jgi:hypothetical protein